MADQHTQFQKTGVQAKKLRQTRETRAKTGLIGLEIITALLFLVTLFPIFLVLINSGKTAFSVTASPLTLPEDWLQIFRNMKTIWVDPNIQYGSSFYSSLLITVFSVGAIILISAQAAWVLVRSKTRIAAFLFMMFVAAMTIPFQIVMLPLVQWFRILGDFIGFRLLRTYPGMILSYMGFGMSLSIFLYHGFIKGIPYELEEAAIIDGASRVGTFYQIVFPLLKPITATVMILNGIWIWNDYLLPLLILGKGNRIQTIPLAVANFAGAYVKQWDLILTAILMAMIPVIIVFLIAQKQIIKGMVAGSIK
ncbi:carbohydrate ABC transporter permease [Spirochaeta lutea]|uniref:carbohydrate ABC transporter permease n=1 Tax=Spirochaeta lutea TaxID=1480694 RepID=UPI0009DD71DE|nr:carbohydrate ABC transporter permease [Spirochaeta lutea]